jgi:acetoin utilization protein AcuA
MIRERLSCSERLEEEEKQIGARPVRIYETPGGKLLLARHCSPELVERLRAHDGLRAFARRPEREHQLLLSIARQPQSSLTLAYTLSGEIVGQVTLAPAGPQWQEIADVCEVAIEVSSGWRRRGIAHQLLRYTFDLQDLERKIIIGLGLTWHWDFEEAGLSRFQYRAMIERLFAAYGFVEYLTSEANIRMDPANIFLARLGSQVGREDIAQFFQCLFQSEELPGL